MDKNQPILNPYQMEDINKKLDQILYNQQQLFELLGEIGNALVSYAKLNKVVRQEEIYSERHKAILARYGEVCQKKEAAEILNVSPRTVARWIDEGRLKTIGNQVDVRSNCAYLDCGISNGKRIRKKKKDAWRMTSGADSIEMAAEVKENIFARNTSEMSEFERAARGIKE